MIYALGAIAGGWHYHRRSTAASTSRWPAWASTAAAAIGADLAIRSLGEAILGQAFTSNAIAVVITTTTAAYATRLPIQLLVSERLIPEPLAASGWPFPSRH